MRRYGFFIHFPRAFAVRNHWIFSSTSQHKSKEALKSIMALSAWSSLLRLPRFFRLADSILTATSTSTFHSWENSSTAARRIVTIKVHLFPPDSLLYRMVNILFAATANPYFMNVPPGEHTMPTDFPETTARCFRAEVSLICWHSGASAKHFKTLKQNIFS